MNIYVRPIGRSDTKKIGACMKVKVFNLESQSFAINQIQKVALVYGLKVQ